MSIYYVQIHYGPYETFGVMSLKPQKVTGIRDALRRFGYRVDQRPNKNFNLCVLEMCGYEVYRCNIKNLKFNLSIWEDEIAMRAVNAVLHATKQFRYCGTYNWLWRMIEGELFGRNEYSYKNKYLSSDMDESETFASTQFCAKCCNLLLAKKPSDELSAMEEIDELDEYFDILKI